ncbi:MAG: hypothetical protein ACNS60_05560 [Candidatus Cyclobacteriaceae bacterium M2_1C_046]
MKRFSIFCVVLFGCDSDYFFDIEGITDPKWSPNVAIPIGYAEYSIKELLNAADSLIEVQEDQDNFVTLVYERELFSESASSFIGLVDQNYSETYNINIPPPLPDPVIASGVNFTTTKNLSFYYNPGENVGVDSVFFKSAVLNTSVTSTIKAEVNAEITFRNLHVKNTSYSFILNLDNFGSANVTTQLSDTLKNLKIDLSKDDLLVDIKLDITTYGAPVSSTDQLSVSIQLQDFSFQAFYGNVGTRTLLLDDERFTFDIFNEFNFGEIYFDDPRLVFTLKNSFGIPVAVDMNRVNAEDPQDGRLYLNGPIVSNPPKVNAPDYSQIGDPQLTVVSIDKTNSNFNELISTLPTALNIPIDATTNPAGETENFVLDTSRIDIVLAAEVPLDLRIANLGNDFIFTFSSGDLSDFKEALLRINIVNGFPLEGKAEVTFRNDSSDNLLTITPEGNFENPLFDGAPVDENGFVTSPSSTTTDFLLTSDDLRLIEKATEVKLDVELNTTDAVGGETVKLLSNYKIKINLGIETGLEL